MTVALITDTQTIPCGEVKAYPCKTDEYVTINLRDIVHGKLPREPFSDGYYLMAESIATLLVRATNARMTVNAPFHLNYREIQTHDDASVIGGELAQEVFQDDGTSDFWSAGQLLQKWLTQQPLTRYVTRKMRMQHQFISLDDDIEVWFEGIPDDRPVEPDDVQIVASLSGVLGAGRIRIATGYPDIEAYAGTPPPLDWLGYKIRVQRYASGTLAAPELTFMFREPCAGARVLQFRNSLEAFDTVLFTSPAEYGLDIGKEVYVTGSLDHAPQGDTARFAPRDQLGVAQVQTTESITVRSEFLNEEQMKWLRELLASDEVYEDYYAQWQEAGGGDEWYPNNLRPVIIRPGSIKWYTEQAATTLYQLELTYEYSGYTNQHYRR